MNRLVGKSEFEFEAFSVFYQKELQKQLFQNTNPNSPINSACNEWIRGQLGIKTLEDIKRESLLEYQRLVFLCEHNLVFNLMFHNRFDLLRLLFEKFEAKNKGHSDNKEKRKQTAQTITTTSKTTEVAIATTTQVEALFQHVESLRKEQPKFERWLLLQENLQQLGYAHAAERSRVRYEAYQEIEKLLTGYVSAESDEPLIREVFAYFLQNNRSQARALSKMIEELNLYPEKALEKEKAITHACDSFIQETRKLIETYGDETKKLLQEHTKIENTLKKKMEKTNHHFEGLKTVAKAQVYAAKKEALLEQKERISTLKNFVLGARRTLQDTLTEEQTVAFDKCFWQLERHYQAIDSVNTKEAIQALLNTCGETLSNFIEVAEKIPAMQTTTTGLKEMTTSFLELAKKTMNIPFAIPAYASSPDMTARPTTTPFQLPLNGIYELPHTQGNSQSARKETSEKEVHSTPINPERKTEEVHNFASLQQRQMREGLQAVREEKLVIADEQDLSPVAEEQYKKAEKAINILIEELSSAKEELSDRNELLTQIEVFAQSIQRTFNEQKGISSSHLSQLELLIDNVFERNCGVDSLGEALNALEELSNYLEKPSRGMGLH